MSNTELRLQLQSLQQENRALSQQLTQTSIKLQTMTEKMMLIEESRHADNHTLLQLSEKIKQVCLLHISLLHNQHCRSWNGGKRPQQRQLFLKQLQQQ